MDSCAPFKDADASGPELAVAVSIQKSRVRKIGDGHPTHLVGRGSVVDDIVGSVHARSQHRPPSVEHLLRATEAAVPVASHQLDLGGAGTVDEDVGIAVAVVIPHEQGLRLMTAG